jgi:methylglutamate dehydrogenase subunit D
VAEPLVASSVFRPMPEPGAAGAAPSAACAVHERTSIALATVIARRGRASDLSAKVAEAFGVELPAIPVRHTCGSVAFAWAGPGRWLAECGGETGDRFETRLRSVLGGLAAVSDQSDGLVVLRLSGARARDVLAKGLPIDTHPGVMQPGSVALSAVDHIGVHLWQLDDAPTYDCAVARSYARDFLHWIETAAAEYRRP